MPTPPLTCSAPETVFAATVVAVSVNVFWNIGPAEFAPLLTNKSPTVPGPKKLV